jgi:hypothetical protein
VLIISADQLQALQRSSKKSGVVRLVMDESLTHPGTLLVSEWYESGLCVNYAINEEGKVKII